MLNDTWTEKFIRVPSEINLNLIGGTKDRVKTSQIGGSKGGSESQILTSEENQIAISSQPQKAANLYFFIKIKLDSGRFYRYFVVFFLILRIPIKKKIVKKLLSKKKFT